MKRKTETEFEFGVWSGSSEQVKRMILLCESRVEEFRTAAVKAVEARSRRQVDEFEKRAVANGSADEAVERHRTAAERELASELRDVERAWETTVEYEEGIFTLTRKGHGESLFESINWQDVTGLQLRTPTYGQPVQIRFRLTTILLISQVHIEGVDDDWVRATRQILLREIERNREWWHRLRDPLALGGFSGCVSLVVCALLWALLAGRADMDSTDAQFLAMILTILVFFGIAALTIAAISRLVPRVQIPEAGAASRGKSVFNYLTVTLVATIPLGIVLNLVTR